MGRSDPCGSHQREALSSGNFGIKSTVGWNPTATRIKPAGRVSSPVRCEVGGIDLQKTIQNNDCLDYAVGKVQRQG